MKTPVLSLLLLFCAGPLFAQNYKSHSHANKSVLDAITSTSVLPSQTSHSGKFLTTNGTTPSWSLVPIGTGVSGLGTGIATALGVNTGSAGAPVLFNGAAGTPSSIILTNGTGLPIATGVSGLGTGVATALAVNTGSAGAVLLFNGAGGTPSSLTLTNATGLPVATGISGFGTGVATALAVNTGSAGAVVLFDGALGTPSSGTGTNITGVNAATLGGATFAAPGAIGGGTPGAGTFTTLTATSNGASVTLIDANDGAPGMAISRQGTNIWGISRGDLAGGTQCAQWGTASPDFAIRGTLSLGTAYTSRDATLSRLAATVIGVTGLGAASVQALSGAGAVDLVTLTTEITSTGVADALTLANGVAGQIKTIIHGVDGGSSVLTPTTKTGFSTITFTNAGEACILQYVTTRGWIILSIQGAVAAP